MCQSGHIRAMQLINHRIKSNTQKMAMCVEVEREGAAPDIENECAAGSVMVAERLKERNLHGGSKTGSLDCSVHEF